MVYSKSMHFWTKITKEKSTSQKQIPETNSLKLLHLRLGHRSPRSLLAGDTAKFWQEIELRVDPDTFCTSCQIPTINKKYISNTHLNPKTHFKWVRMYIIPATSSNLSTKDTYFFH